MVGFFVGKTMWVRFQKEKPGVAKFQTVWMEDDDEAIAMIKDGDVARVTGPDGVAFEEATPENQIEQMAREENRTFKDMEKELERRRKGKQDRDKNPDKDKKVKSSRKGGEE